MKINTIKKGNKKKNPIYAKYRHIQQVKCVYSKRYNNDPFYKDDYENFKKKSKEFKSNIKKGTATLEDFDKWLDTQDKTKQGVLK